MTIKEKILKIMSLALEINPPEVKYIRQKRTAAFVRWSPHCNVFGIDIHYGGWKESAFSDESISLYTNSKDAAESLDAVIANLEKIKEELCG